MNKSLGVLIFLFHLSSNAESMLPIRETPFSRESLLKESSVRLANPSGFSMHQSYTIQFTSSAWGTNSSGYYLNTLSYNFSVPLTLSVDVGLYNLFYASAMPAIGYQGQTPRDTRPELIIPRIALDYQPTENMNLSLQLINLRSASRAYGPFWSEPWWRTH